MRELELRLQVENPRYRRIWVQPVRVRGGSRHVIITLFPQGFGDYRMIFGNPVDFTYDSMNEILINYLLNDII